MSVAIHVGPVCLTDTRYEVYTRGRAPEYFRRGNVAEFYARETALKTKQAVYMFDRFAQFGAGERWKFISTKDVCERVIKILIGFKGE